jgi:hypothetical protein
MLILLDCIHKWTIPNQFKVCIPSTTLSTVQTWQKRRKNHFWIIFVKNSQDMKNERFYTVWPWLVFVFFLWLTAQIFDRLLLSSSVRNVLSVVSTFWKKAIAVNHWVMKPEESVILWFRLFLLFHEKKLPQIWANFCFSLPLIKELNWPWPQVKRKDL